MPYEYNNDVCEHWFDNFHQFLALFYQCFELRERRNKKKKSTKMIESMLKREIHDMRVKCTNHYMGM